VQEQTAVIDVVDHCSSSILSSCKTTLRYLSMTYANKTHKSRLNYEIKHGLCKIAQK